MGTYFKYKTKNERHNIVMEVGTQIRKQILQINLKFLWVICNVANYIIPSRCYKCTQYNHKHTKCK